MEFEGLLNFIIENKQVFHFSIAVFWKKKCELNIFSNFSLDLLHIDTSEF